jgi:hypothetical protein
MSGLQALLDAIEHMSYFFVSAFGVVLVPQEHAIQPALTETRGMTGSFSP